MSDISRWLEIVDQLYTRDITGLMNTVRSAFSETSFAEESCDSSWFELATTSENLRILRTAKMMDQPSGADSENPTVPPGGNTRRSSAPAAFNTEPLAAPAEGNTENPAAPPEVKRATSVLTRLGEFMFCFLKPPRRVHDEGTVNQQRANTSPTTNPAPSGSNTTPTTNPTSNTEPPVKRFIPKPGTRTTNKVPLKPMPSTSSAPDKRTDGQGTSGTNQESPINWDEPLDIVSEHGSTDNDDDLPNSTPESNIDEPSTSTPKPPKSILKNSGNNTDYKNGQNGNNEARKGGSVGVRDANALYVPELNENSNGSSTPHHSELFGSFNLEHLTEVDSGDWLDYFRDEYSERSSFWN